MPFPSEPKVSEGDVTVFKRAVRLINAEIPCSPSVHLARGVLKSAETPASRSPAEITFHERIGAHDVSVVRSPDQSFADLRRHREDVKLRIWRITGYFDSLDRDIFTT